MFDVLDFVSIFFLTFLFPPFPTVFWMILHSLLVIEVDGRRTAEAKGTALAQMEIRRKASIRMFPYMFVSLVMFSLFYCFFFFSSSSSLSYLCRVQFLNVSIGKKFWNILILSNFLISSWLLFFFSFSFCWSSYFFRPFLFENVLHSFFGVCDRLPAIDDQEELFQLLPRLFVYTMLTMGGIFFLIVIDFRR